MANTIKYDNNRIVIYPDGTSDFDITTLSNKFAKGIKLTSIEFHPSAATDSIKVRNGSTTATLMFWPTNYQIKYFDGTVQFPCFKASECTWTTPASSAIILTGFPA